MISDYRFSWFLWLISDCLLSLHKYMKQIEVIAAIIHDFERRFFATQRGYGDMKDGWEFTGGKVEPGELPEEALKREIWEGLETLFR